MSIIYRLNFALSVNNSHMTKKEYVEKMANLIVNRVRFHAPIVYDDNIDFELLEVIGIDPSLPVFKYEKSLDNVMADAFLLAQKEVSFNLLTTTQPTCKKCKIDALKNYVYIRTEELGYSLLSTINALNINYKSGCEFNKEIEEDYIKVNDEIVNLNYQNYYLYKKASSNGVVYEIKEFLLNGKNFILNFTNLREEKQIATFEINVVLPRGYYHFKRENNAIKITSLTSGETAYFNFQSRNAKFSFSTISGVESSTHACINMKINISINGKAQKRFYFNYGENKYCFSSIRDSEDFFDISQKKMCEIFDLKVLSRDKSFDEEFNRSLPQKIWLSWLKMTTDEESEKKYLKLKNSVAKKVKNGWQISENFKGLKQVQIYENSGYRRVFIVEGNERYILSGKTKYLNFTNVTNEIFQKNNEIYLSFGS